MKDRNRFKDCKRIVIKVGTAVLTHESGQLNLKRIERLAWVLSDLRNQGKQVILVSSGAIAVGADRLKLQERPRDVLGKQAAAAVGQGILMQIYENFFMTYNQVVAQILLTSNVITNQELKTNAMNTLFSLLNMGVVPIVNENDTVATDELGAFGDNDDLSARVACLVDSDCFIILSDVKGLYDDDPRRHPDAELIKKVTAINEQIRAHAGEAATQLGTGGMATKIAAAERAMKNGIDTVITSGDDPTVIFRILDGESIGTFFAARRGE